MTDQRHDSDPSLAEYPAREPSIPETHDSIELTRDSVIVYDETDPTRWIWADETVHLAERR